MTTINHTRVIVFSIDTGTDLGNEAMNVLLEGLSSHSEVAVDVRSAVGVDVVEVKVTALDHLISQEVRDLCTEMSDYIVESVLVTEDA